MYSLHSIRPIVNRVANKFNRKSLRSFIRIGWLIRDADTKAEHLRPEHKHMTRPIFIANANRFYLQLFIIYNSYVTVTTVFARKAGDYFIMVDDKIL